MRKCEVCNAEVSELRRGRCWGCYSRWVDERPVGYGARCILCAEPRRDRLKSVELLGGWWPACYNCAGQAAKLSPMPQSISELRRAVQRERRAGERRVGKPESRVFPYERRAAERRVGRSKSWSDTLGEDVLSDILDGVLEAVRQAEAEARSGARGKPRRASRDRELTQIRAVEVQ